MRILGIDPGLNIMGYGVIDEAKGKLTAIDYGCVYTNAGVPLPLRLNKLYDGVYELIEKYKPEAVAVEELFFAKNVKTAITVAHARGVVLLCAQKLGIALFEYTPLQVKQAVVGYGRAEKHQIQTLVKIILNLAEIPKPDDAADALAVAVCHAHSMKFSESFSIK